MNQPIPPLLSPIAMQHALKEGHYAKAIKALKAGQDIHAAIPQPPSPYPPHKPAPLAEMWHWEKTERAMETMQLLLQAGADPNAPDSMGRRPLHTWLWLAHAPKQAVQALVVAGANPLFKSAITVGPQKTTQSALQVCVFRGLSEELAWITECLPDIGARHDEHWEEPIMRNAIQNTREDTPENRKLLLTLLEAGASIDAVDKFGRSGRGEAISYQLTLIAQWEAVVRSKQEAQALEQETPTARTNPGQRRI